MIGRSDGGPSATTVGVAMCTFNGSRFIVDQLNSILGQTRLPDEIIVSDDGSTDDTVQIVDATLAGSPVSYRILRNPHPLGVSRNFEQAVRASTTDLIVLSDQDDIWHPGRLELTTALFDADPTLTAAFGDARIIDAEGTDLGFSLFDAIAVTAAERAALRSDAAFSCLLRRNLATGATTAFRRSLLDVALPFPPEWVHDEWLVSLAAAVGTLEVIESPVIDYRQHGANQIGAWRPTISHKVRRVLMPRGDRNIQLARRTGILVDKLDSLGELVRPADVAAARGKLRIESARADLPANRLFRVLPVFREARTGDYARFTSQGSVEILRDLLQPR